MQIRQLLLLWEASGHITGDRGYIGILRRLRFLMNALKNGAALKPLLRADSESLLARTVAARPQVLGFAVAPYICKSWTADERIRTFARNINVAERFGSLLNFEVDYQIDLMKLDHLGSDFWLVIDKPIWFHREGIATLNLFLGQVRLFTLSFSIDDIANERIATIGGIQGRNIDYILDIYRDMTKASAGMRPRDLTIEIFRSLCRYVGVDRILAVSDASRHQRSIFFKKEAAKLTLNYDEIWLDRGGLQISTDFFELSVNRHDRNADDIPAKKRALYRKRYELLDRLEKQLEQALMSISIHLISRKE